MDQIVRDLLDEFQSLKEIRKPYEEVWQEIADNVVPNRSGFLTDEPDKGRRRGELIQDGTPLHSLQTYKSGLMGRLLSSFFNWFSVRTPDEDLMDVREIRMWLSKVDQVLYGMIARSNFYPQMFEFFGDGGSIGTATIYRYWNAATQREIFSVRHPREIYVAENEESDVDTIFRPTLMSYKQMVDSFGEDELDEEVRKYAKDPEMRHQEGKILHVVKPNRKYNPKKKNQEAKKYSSWYIDIDHENIIRRRGYRMFPYAIWRVEKEPDEMYGRGPGWRALADIKSLYAYAKTDITAAQMLVNPPLDIPVERRGQTKWVPGGRNYYEDVNRRIFQPTQNVDIRAGLEREQQKQKIIEKHFMVPFFTMMQNIGEMTRERTAYEVRRIEEETAILLGPHITGLNQDVMDKLIDGMFDDAWEAGLIPPPPARLIESLNGRRLEVDYMGPLALAQRSYFHAEPYRKTLSDIGNVIAIDPTGQTSRALDNFDWDRVTREMAKSNGLPEEAMFDERKVAQMRQIRAQQMAQQQQMAALESVGKAMPGLSKAPEGGSVADALGKAKPGTPAA